MDLILSNFGEDLAFVTERVCLSSLVSVPSIRVCAVVWKTLVPIQPLPPIVCIPLSPVCLPEVTSEALPHHTAQPSLNTLTVMLP